MPKQEEIQKFTAELTKKLKEGGMTVIPYPGGRPKLLVTDADNGYIVSVRPM